MPGYGACAPCWRFRRRTPLLRFGYRSGRHFELDSQGRTPGPAACGVTFVRVFRITGIDDDAQLLHEPLADGGVGYDTAADQLLR